LFFWNNNFTLIQGTLPLGAGIFFTLSCIHLSGSSDSYQRKKKNDLGHTTYSRNNMGQKCEGNCGLWILNEIIFKKYPENLKKIVGAVWELL
jgi:hypothetical protein